MINGSKDVNGKMESFRWTQEEDFEKYVKWASQGRDLTFAEGGWSVGDIVRRIL